MKYKKLTIVIHLLFWIAFIVPPLVTSPPEGNRQPVSPIRNPYFLGVTTLVLMIIFYLNYHYLIPKYKLTHKRWMYLALISLVVASYLCLHHVLDVLLSPGRGTFEIGGEWIMPSLSILFLILTLSYALRMSAEWQTTEKARTEIEKEMSRAEIIYLKSQINPHFFFNTLNGIYALSIARSELTSKAIQQLSEMMRYVLYESEKKTVALDKEIDYMRSYLAMQRLRLSSNNQVCFEVQGRTEGIKILPLLFIPFIENALKFGVSMDDTTLIQLSVAAEPNGVVRFFCQNHIMAERETVNCSGIGIQNVRRRLELSYAGRYQLDLGYYGNNFLVQLTLELG